MILIFLFILYLIVNVTLAAPGTATIASAVLNGVVLVVIGFFIKDFKDEMENRDD